jgi:hypothetical protein
MPAQLRLAGAITAHPQRGTLLVLARSDGSQARAMIVNHSSEMRADDTDRAYKALVDQAAPGRTAAYHLPLLKYQTLSLCERSTR